MRKYQLDLWVKDNVAVSDKAFMLVLEADAPLPEARAGQFVEVEVPGGEVLLRRPISIHDIDRSQNTISLLIQKVGKGTNTLAQVAVGQRLNVILPLGNGFDYAGGGFFKPLLVGGGVGVAPLLHLGRELKALGIEPTFLFGGRSKTFLLRLDEFEKYGPVYATTEDASFGEKGFVTDHSILKDSKFDIVFACGPTPMLHSVARYAAMAGIQCQVSLEHRMACGIGACLCCVEDTVDGNLCVCKEGPVFTVDKLKWQI